MKNASFLKNKLERNTTDTFKVNITTLSHSSVKLCNSELSKKTELDCLPSVWACASSCQALKCPSLLVETSMVVWLSVEWQKHMPVIWASWGAEMVVFSTKLQVIQSACYRAVVGNFFYSLDF